MSEAKRQLLVEELAAIEKSAGHLRVSLVRSEGLVGCVDASVDDMERLEALTSRFARLADLLLQRVMRLIDELELVPGGTLLDRIFLAEKRGWVDSAQALINIRELRNVIAHEYSIERLTEIHGGIVSLAPDLLAAVEQVTAHGRKLVVRLGG